VKRTLAVVVLVLALAGCTTGAITTSTTTTTATLPAPAIAMGGRTGAVCADGWLSSATGQGACSHHGGVDYWTHAISEPEATVPDVATMDGTQVVLNGNDPIDFTWHDLAVGAGQSDDVPGAGATVAQIMAACDAFFDSLFLHTNMAEVYRERFDQVCTDAANYG
jgi:hypothetical protein